MRAMGCFFCLCRLKVRRDHDWLQVFTLCFGFNGCFLDVGTISC